MSNAEIKSWRTPERIFTILRRPNYEHSIHFLTTDTANGDRRLGIFISRQDAIEIAGTIYASFGMSLTPYPTPHEKIEYACRLLDEAFWELENE